MQFCDDGLLCVVVFEASFAEVEQMVASRRFRCFLALDVASRSDAGRDIGLF